MGEGNSQREMTLEEWVNTLPGPHRAKRELAELKTPGYDKGFADGIQSNVKLKQERIAELEAQLAETEQYYAQGIRDDAERVGIDTRGLIGMAIVHTIVEKITALRADKERLDWLEGRITYMFSGAGKPAWMISDPTEPLRQSIDAARNESTTTKETTNVSTDD